MATLLVDAIKARENHGRKYSLSLTQSSNSWQSIEFNEIKLLPSVYASQQVVDLCARGGIEDYTKRPLDGRFYFVGDFDL